MVLRCISIGDRPTADCGGVHQRKCSMLFRSMTMPFVV